MYLICQLNEESDHDDQDYAVPIYLETLGFLWLLILLGTVAVVLYFKKGSKAGAQGSWATKWRCRMTDNFRDIVLGGGALFSPSSSSSTSSSPSSSSSATTATSSVLGGSRVFRRRVRNLKYQIKRRMDLMFETFNSDGGDFPNCESPVWMFGRSYSTSYDLEELRRSVASCMWLTYRKNFATVGETTLTSDRGWGCMIRTGQMLLAKTLIVRHLGSDWHWSPDCRDTPYLKIVSLFADQSSAPFSLHRIAQCGATLGKEVGSWLGPNTVCQALKKLLSGGCTSLDLTIHIAMDSSLVQSEVKKHCLSHPTINPFSTPTIPCSNIINTPRIDPKWKPLLLVVPLRLGLSDLNPTYVPALKAIFEIPQTIGIIGGRPNHALYFIGYAENEVLYLDPHTVQPTVHVGAKTADTEKAADETYHLQKPGRMSFLSMDPSIALCFYCKSEADFDTLCKKLVERFSQCPLALFELCERRPDDWIDYLNCDPSTSAALRKERHPSTSTGEFINIESPHLAHNFSSSDGDDEDFEILG